MKRRRQRGTAIVEFSLVVLPLMACILMTLDVAWVIFAWASLQEGVREGVRFAVTGQTSFALNGQTYNNACQDAAIREIIEIYSFGFVNSTNASSVVGIQYYSPLTMQALSGSGSNAGGNVVKITAGPISVGTFGPIFRNWTPINLYAASSDVMEGSPNSVPPCR